MIITFPEIELRPAKEADSDAMIDLVHEAWHEVYAPHLPRHIARQQTRRQSARLIETDSSLRWVATRGPRLLGYCGVLGNCVDQLWVRAAHRRRGIGSALMERAVRSLIGRGFRSAQAGCEDFNLVLREFLLHHGWRLIGNETCITTSSHRITAHVYAIDLPAREGDDGHRALAPAGRVDSIAEKETR